MCVIVCMVYKLGPGVLSIDDLRAVLKDRDRSIVDRQEILSYPL